MAWRSVWLAMMAMVCASGCVQLPRGGPSEVAQVERELQRVLPAGPASERRRIAETAVQTGAELARRYGVTTGPWIHNTMVNVGLRERGLCWQWAEDLTDALGRLGLRGHEVHWGKANGGTLREHNTVVVTARGQDFADGLVLDPWRGSGVIFAVRTREDPKYRWRKMDPPARSR
ncbi:MAG: hypothetical protein JSR82_03930 [Verrucomicrobia bacterium]|nr:hypothetical protein [Verrucomicrobiota bacterium]